MKLPFTTIALFASLLVFGCATEQQQQFTPTQTTLEKKDQRYGISQFDGRFRSSAVPWIRLTKAYGNCETQEVTKECTTSRQPSR